MTIGKRIEYHLDRLGMTRTELARRLKLRSPSAVTNWITGANNPSAGRLAQVAAALQVADLAGFVASAKFPPRRKRQRQRR